MKHKLIMALIPVAAFIIRLIGWSMRIRLVDPKGLAPQAKTKEKFIYAFWHNQQILSTFFFRNFGIHVLVSRSKDGDYIAGALEQLGFQTVRSSSSSGKVTALRGLVKALRKESHVAITPDGPRGPLYKAQPGAVFLAALSGHRVVPFGCAVDRVWRLGKTWDQFEIPKPFSRAKIVYGDAIEIPKRLSDSDTKQFVDQVETEMNRLRQTAQNMLSTSDESRQNS